MSFKSEIVRLRDFSNQCKDLSDFKIKYPIAYKESTKLGISKYLFEKDEALIFKIKQWGKESKSLSEFKLNLTLYKLSIVFNLFDEIESSFLRNKKNELIEDLNNAIKNSPSREYFRKNYPKLYEQGFYLDEFKYHPYIIKHHKLKDEEIEKLLSSYSSLQELKQNKRFYSFLYENKKDLLSMKFPKKELPKTNEEIASLLKEYGNASEFRKKDGRLYRKLLKTNKKLSSIVFKKEKKWTLDKAIKEASRFETRSEFKRKSGGCYTWIRENGYLELVCSNMKDGYVKRHNKKRYTYEEFAEICSQFKSRTDLKRANNWAFDYGEANNWLDALLPNLNDQRSKIKEEKMEKQTKRGILKELAKQFNGEFSSKELKDLAIKSGVILNSDRPLYDFLSKSPYVDRNKKTGKFFLKNNEPVAKITGDDLRKITLEAKESRLNLYCQKIMARARDVAFAGLNSFDHQLDGSIEADSVIERLKTIGVNGELDEDSNKIKISW